nr:thioesterase [bacterium]
VVRVPGDRRDGIDALAGLLHETAWRHAEHSGLGFHALERKGLLWVVSRFRIHAGTMPCRGDMIMIRTWPRHMDRLFAYRDFEIVDGHDAVIARATGMWVIIDMNTRKPVNMQPFRNCFIFHSEKVLDNKLNRLPPVDEPAFHRSITVDWQDLDFNHHVNNLNYIRWILRTIPSRILSDHAVSDLAINHLGEGRLGDHLLATVAKLSGNPLVCHGEIITRDHRNVLARIRLELNPVSRKE